MDVNVLIKGVGGVVRELQSLFKMFRSTSADPDYVQNFSRLLHMFAPVLTVVVFYHYLKYLLLFHAGQYEQWVKKRSGYMKNLSRQLRLLTKRYGNFYYCYMPMSHGTTLPPTYSLFMAIKEVLINSNRPATRVMRTNLLLDLVHGDASDRFGSLRPVDMRDRDLFDTAPDELDPLSEYNLDIMKCSRELIIQGVKDFDVMSTLYRVMETVEEDGDE